MRVIQTGTGEWPDNEFATHPCHRGDGGMLSYDYTEYGGVGANAEHWTCTVHGTHYFQLGD